MTERPVQQEGAVDDPDNFVVELDLKLVAVKRFWLRSLSRPSRAEGS
jgi:hypothetical protein